MISMALFHGTTGEPPASPLPDSGKTEKRESKQPGRGVSGIRGRGAFMPRPVQDSIAIHPMLERLRG